MASCLSHLPDIDLLESEHCEYEAMTESYCKPSCYLFVCFWQQMVSTSHNTLAYIRRSTESVFIAFALGFFSNFPYPASVFSTWEV